MGAGGPPPCIWVPWGWEASSPFRAGSEGRRLEKSAFAPSYSDCSQRGPGAGNGACWSRGALAAGACHAGPRQPSLQLTVAAKMPRVTRGDRTPGDGCFRAAHNQAGSDVSVGGMTSFICVSPGGCCARELPVRGSSPSMAFFTHMPVARLGKQIWK